MSGACNRYGGARFFSCGVLKVLSLYLESAVEKEEHQKASAGANLHCLSWMSKTVSKQTFSSGSNGAY